MTKRKPVAIPRSTCRSCLFFSTATDESKPIQPEFGECRRYPPHMGTDSDGDGFYYWPILENTEWCGEFAQRLDA
jgi:hypothetical protein